MNLVQKLPIVLSLASVLLMTGCSKEEAQMPEPKVESLNVNSNLKTEAVAWIFGTKGYPGYNTLPTFWERTNTGNSDPTAYPAGTSTPSRLWGNNASKWLKPVQLIPYQPWNSFLTVTASSVNDMKKKSAVRTKIGSLKPGKKYSVTVYVANNLPSTGGFGPIPTYAKQCQILIGNQGAGAQTTIIDFANSNNYWIKKTLTFNATAQEMTFDFSAIPAQEGMFTWAHLFVGSDVIQQLN
jgi:hypothetical protein